MTARNTSAAAPRPDPAAVGLTRLLDRLQHALNADPKLRHSSYERTRVGANLEHARSLLLRLEHDAATVKIQSRRQALQADLQTKRDVIKQLNARLHELNQLEDDEEEEDSSEDDADMKAPSYAPAIRNTSDSIDTEQDPALHDAAANLTNTLRSRRSQGPSSSEPTRATTASGSLFDGRSNPAADPKLQKSETVMSHNRSEQEELTSSLLQMAQALKASSVQFSTSLESEKEITDRAVRGLDKNAEGMEAAGKRMGTLRRMTEGKGWWGRVLMYGYIGGLWLLALVIVFVLPKFRF
ncbi:hypothetical protein K490DRAFT_34476 [Saccharata proteae CBS 121410]|uniref:Synaptobrevin n=1 Tax=Saccharata proteae CBS 121410 TaxID=1314787 RepID=A0A9P4I337_9PEZI|nr:hypothetical protein K490DRAFT_34476 [Saccharata proteae CBS 121410]